MPINILVVIGVEADTRNSMSNVRGRKSANEAPHVPEGRLAPAGGMESQIGGMGASGDINQR
ncbi:hypothetical protein ATG_06130 [Desulfurococcaceae archaeon AG1]|nr:hypothetical protein ATG_06130 [Desulfurococcaceae archaeon AG1]